MYIPKTKEDLWSLIKSNVPGDQIDVRHITDMSRLFENSPYNHPLGGDAKGADSYDASSWDVSRVERMISIFSSSKINIGSISRDTWKEKWEAWVRTDLTRTDLTSP